MGSMLISQCQCGYESDELMLGGGMMNFIEDCEIPFYCDNCEIVFTRDVLGKLDFKKYNKCPKCRKKVQYYGSISEDDFENDDDNVFDWGIEFDKRYYLKNDSYHCPKCKKEEMKFYTTGCWD